MEKKREKKKLPENVGNTRKEKLSYWLASTEGKKVREKFRATHVASEQEHYLKKTQLHRKSKKEGVKELREVACRPA